MSWTGTIIAPHSPAAGRENLPRRGRPPHPAVAGPQPTSPVRVAAADDPVRGDHFTSARTLVSVTAATARDGRADPARTHSLRKLPTHSFSLLVKPR